MDKIQLRAYGKINLGLDVLRKRPDGYHDLKMIMQTVGVYDDVIIEKIDEKKQIVVLADKLVLENSKDNLAYKAAKILLDKYKIDQGIKITMHKRIPIAGGMAGGSADCAATLKGINHMFELGLTTEELMKIGVSLGADVPYCVLGGTAIAEGIGDILTPIPQPPKCFTIIAKPPISVSTAYVYGNIKPDRIKVRPDIDGIVDAIKAGDVVTMSKLLYNVMEEVTVNKHPIIQQIKDIMLANKAVNSIMSGSGPTVFGIFKDEATAREAMEAIKKADLTEQLYLTEFVSGQDYIV